MIFSTQSVHNTQCIIIAHTVHYYYSVLYRVQYIIIHTVCMCSKSTLLLDPNLRKQNNDAVVLLCFCSIIAQLVIFCKKKR